MFHRAVGQEQGRGGRIVHAVGNPQHTARVERHLLGEGAMDGEGHHAIARPYAGHARADLLDDAGQLAPR